MICEKCERTIEPKIESPGCPQCLRAHEFSKACRACINTATSKNPFPNFVQSKVSHE